jgi:LmbE family N-acetylglucosaminyl deacetylase
MNFYMQLLHRLSNNYNEDDLKKSAIIFSPHFDDETLGCGGTIIKKKHAGADVTIVFMTDGSKSHNYLITEDKLKAIRKSEGLAASQSLGLATNDVVFLGLEESKLNEHVTSAMDKVTEILLSQKPDEIFIPHHREPAIWSLDHLTTNRIVVSALQLCNREIIVYEYPLWMWYGLFWISMPFDYSKKILTSLNQNLFSGLSMLKDFRCSLYIGDVLELKNAALNQHRSQMTRLNLDPRWKTLEDIANGEFLKCFFQEYEIFHKNIFHEKRKVTKRAGKLGF